MKKRELETALRAASRLAGESEFIVIGSQAVHAYCRRPPVDVLLSQECDLYPVARPETAALLASELGRRSPFARKHGFYVDVVTPEMATLPQGWEKRLKVLLVGRIRGLCIEVHDLLVSKLAAGRLKDLELAASLLNSGLGNVQKLKLRINRLPHAVERSRVRQQLKAVLRDLGRRQFR